MPALRRIRWKRIVLVVLAATTGLLVLGAVRTNRSAHDYDRRFEAWLVAAPCDFAVDLSAPGSWEAPFIQTCDIAHGEPVRLWATGTDGEAIEDRAVLDGLAGWLRVLDGAGAVVAETPLPGSPGSIAPPQGVIPLAYLAAFRKGEYRVQVEVERGAPGLAGAGQRIAVEYELCGLERLPAQIGYLLSGAMWVGAVVVGLTMCVVAIPQARNGKVAPGEAGRETSAH